ncbi:protein-L-isoaspartate O-methyltransferase [Qipengyuania pelagi]|jgi:protein-L-isoaspartate(D-aspartate) O-methyltransferase|uniref:Protein-L-isoaspartate O-methyltransferase n=1 Tax=Qipengyuania pelagi TaxID=994320 RepID=A0A844YCX7_9SPHN|nr:protein-L-isoaspartate O-methyltransferase [Qipengyuania pelagi]MXO54802.1 protein-L-isoaspartate O-methyltransferase [Qipengyuania pelagi]
MTVTAEQPASQSQERQRALDFAAARRAMIDSQLRTSGVNQRFVLERMGAVAREEFVPASARGTAYMDRAIRLENGGFLPAPVFHGMMLEEAAPRADDVVVVVDGGSGYLAELVRPLVTSVETLDADSAAKGDVTQSGATLLLIDGAIEHLPAGLAGMLADGGRVVTGLVERGVTRLATGRKVAGSLGLLPLAETGIPRLGQFDKPVGWTF